MAQGWQAYPSTPPRQRRMPWTADAIYAYLRHGWQAQHGVALGPMGEVTHNLAGAPDEDVRAIATYVAAQIGTPAPIAARRRHRPHHRRIGRGALRGACANCHEGGRGPPFGGIDLALSSALHAPNPTTSPISWSAAFRPAGEDRAPIMPGFGAVLTDRQMADLLTWLRARFGAAQPWDGIDDAVAGGARHHCPARGSAMRLNVNGQDHDIDADPDTPLLYVLRDDLGLNGAKFGCGLGQCGACTVMVDDQAVFSCLTPVAALEGKQIGTLEGLGTVDHPGPVQARLHRGTGGAMRLLHRRHDHAGAGAAGAQPAPDRAEIRAAMHRTSAAAARICASCAPYAAPLCAMQAAAAARRMTACRRRAVLAGSGALVVGFALRGRAQTQPGARPARRNAAALPGSLKETPLAGCLDPHRRRRHDHRVHRQGRTRPGHQDRAAAGRRRGAVRRRSDASSWSPPIRR